MVRAMPRPMDFDKTEKITINLGAVDLGQIDLLVSEGFYTNRTDFIRTAIRAQLATQAATVQRTAERRTLVLGIQRFGRAELERLRKEGRSVRIRVLGLAVIDDDVDPELALETITEIEVLGAFRAGAAVKAALGSRII